MRRSCAAPILGALAKFGPDQPIGGAGAQGVDAPGERLAQLGERLYARQIEQALATVEQREPPRTGWGASWLPVLVESFMLPLTLGSPQPRPALASRQRYKRS